MKDPTIADVLSRPTGAPAQFKITPAQRVYYNYDLHEPSRDLENANRGHDARPRDFRSMREKEQDDR